MSPPPPPLGSKSLRFPRVSGDEPWGCLAVAVLLPFSPRERG